MWFQKNIFLNKISDFSSSIFNADNISDCDQVTCFRYERRINYSISCLIFWYSLYYCLGLFLLLDKSIERRYGRLLVYWLAPFRDLSHNPPWISINLIWNYRSLCVWLIVSIDRNLSPSQPLTPNISQNDYLFYYRYLCAVIKALIFRPTWQIKHELNKQTKKNR